MSNTQSQQNNKKLKLELSTDDKEDKPVYIAGNFNNWTENSEQFKMTKVGEGHFEYTFDDIGVLPPHIEYKYTRGNWNDEELDSFGNRTPNRVINKFQQKIADFVPRWLSNGQSFQPKFLPIIETVSEHFEIPQLNKNRRIRILLPFDYYETDKRYPVLYMQDGQNLFDKDAPFGNWGMDERLAVLAEYGNGDLIVVAIDHGERERINEFSPRDAIEMKIGEREGTKYVQFMCETLKPHIDRYYRTRPEREYTGVGGSSMGGLISLYGGIQHANVFGRLMIFSPSLWIYPDVYEEVLEKGALADTKLYLFAGGRESKGMLPNIHRLQHQIYKKEEKVELNLVIDPNGTHSESRWNSEFPEAVEWLFF